MTATELKELHLRVDPNSHFFTSKTMRFFGDRMSNYGVQKTTVETWSSGAVEVYELYRKKPVKCGNQKSAYFNLSGRHVLKKID